MSLRRKVHQDLSGWRKNAKYSLVARLINVKSGTIVSIPRNPEGIVVGRSSSCDIKLTGNDISSRHAQFSLSFRDGHEIITVRDTSSNGLYVNGERLGNQGKAVLKSGDKLDFAKSHTFIFRYVRDIEGGRSSFFDDYILGAQLGAGHYAVVKEARSRASGEVVAVKIFHPRKSATPQAAEAEDAKLTQEMELLLSVSHTNIVKFIGKYTEPIAENQTTTYLVLEKMNGGELFQRIISKGKLAQDETREVFRQLLNGLAYLHNNHIIHRDIKPENILLDVTPITHPDQTPTGPWGPGEFDLKVKIADFGLAKFTGELQFTHTLCGTPAYVAPEVLTKNRNYTSKVDVWSAGVLLYVCLCGFPPFSEELAPPSMKEQIVEGKYAFFSPYWDDIDDMALDCIDKMLVVDAEHRYSVADVLAHPWFVTSESDESQPYSMDISSGPSDWSQGTQGSFRRIAVRQDSIPITLKERQELQVPIELAE
ncbi:DNA damage response protein kinase Dun1p [Diutina catenulata]